MRFCRLSWSYSKMFTSVQRSLTLTWHLLFQIQYPSLALGQARNLGVLVVCSYRHISLINPAPETLWKHSDSFLQPLILFKRSIFMMFSSGTFTFCFRAVVTHPRTRTVLWGKWSRKSCWLGSHSMILSQDLVFGTFHFDNVCKLWPAVK